MQKVHKYSRWKWKRLKEMAEIYLNTLYGELVYLTSEHWIPDMVANLAAYTERFDQAIVWYDSFASQFDRIVRKANKTKTRRRKKKTNNRKWLCGKGTAETVPT